MLRKNSEKKKIELGSLVAWIALLVSLLSSSFSIYSYSTPPAPKLKIVEEVIGTTNGGQAEYRFFIVNYSKGNGIVKFKGLSVDKPKTRNNEFFSLDDSPYQNKYYIIEGNSVSQEVLEFSDDFIKGILNLRKPTQKHFYVVFEDEKQEIIYKKINIYSD